jgi:hypothetical protein
MFRSIRQRFNWTRNSRPGFSVICIYNNRQKLDKYLVRSLNTQTAPYEILAIDNTDGHIKSAPEVLNMAAKKARYDYLMFVHQDVELDSKNWLAKAQIDLNSLYCPGAAGVAGRSSEGFASSVSHGNPPTFTGPMRLQKPAQVQTLDGCLIIVPKKIFSKISFDEATIEGFYLYVVDYCLDLMRLGYRNYVLPHPVYHESTGPGDSSVYQKTLDNIINKHRKSVKVIYSTVGEWKTITS